MSKHCFSFSFSFTRVYTLSFVVFFEETLEIKTKDTALFAKYINIIYSSFCTIIFTTAMYKFYKTKYSANAFRVLSCTWELLTCLLEMFFIALFFDK